MSGGFFVVEVHLESQFLWYSEITVVNIWQLNNDIIAATVPYLHRFP